MPPACVKIESLTLPTAEELKGVDRFHGRKVLGQPGRRAGGLAIGNLFEKFFDLSGDQVARRGAVPFDVGDLAAAFVGEHKLGPVVITSGFNGQRTREVCLG